MTERRVDAKKLELLAHVPEPLRTQVIGRLRTMRASKGRNLLEKGSRSADVFFLLAGRAQVLLYSSNGREVSIHTVGPGQMFGEMASLDDQPRSASVLALSEVEYAVMRAVDFLACVESSPAAGKWIVRRLVASVRSLTERLFELMALNVQTRIHCELLRLAQGGELRGGIIEIHDPPTHAEIANRIGTHREAVTRELQALSAMKIIRHGRGKLQILDLARLERAANTQ